MARTTKKSRGLGRGLSALMSDVAQEGSDNTPADRSSATVPIESIHPNPDQPRRTFDPDALDELTKSVAEKGIIQPLVVRRSSNNSAEYEIVAGERRWRAAQKAQLHEIPVIVRDYDDTEVLEIAIIENIQRDDLNAIDEAAGYQHLMERFGHTQEKLATALGKSRSHIANLMRLLSLPDEVQKLLVTGALTAGHARALIGHPEALKLAQEVVRSKLSVRDTEKLAKQDTPRSKSKEPRRTKQKDADTVAIESELTAGLGMKVSIDHISEEKGGMLSISYKSLDQLDELLRALSNR